MIIKANFDPITAKEMIIIKSYLKKNKEVFLYINDAGVASKEVRKRLLKKAIKPYRHIYIIDEAIADLEIEDDEELVRSGAYHLCARGIQKDLIEKGYYFEYLVEKMCSEYRYKHSMSVASTAEKLAKHYGINEKYVYNIGLLHDVTKDLSLENNKQLLEGQDEILKYSSKVWHSFSAPIWLKKNLGIKDKRFLNAIERHTLGNTKTIYDDIVYVADKIEPLRTYDITKETKLAYQDIKKAALFIREEVKEIIESKENNHV